MHNVYGIHRLVAMTSDLDYGYLPHGYTMCTRAYIEQYYCTSVEETATQKSIVGCVVVMCNDWQARRDGRESYRGGGKSGTIVSRAEHSNRWSV